MGFTFALLSLLIVKARPPTIFLPRGPISLATLLLRAAPLTWSQAAAILSCLPTEHAEPHSNSTYRSVLIRACPNRVHRASTRTKQTKQGSRHRTQRRMSLSIDFLCLYFWGQSLRPIQDNFKLFKIRPHLMNL